ncbi:RHS repeat-associated core domain-containing protein [Nonomuraea sp. NPDC049141]|uniref:RHS repeat-associated core domain-containing protein n=1 Tax=Nonomuraea sp. NPDC049141 TaxID=3155500 RepID=UPI0034099DBF
MVVLGQRDFDRALAAAYESRVTSPQPVDLEVRDRAAALAGRANDPAALGVLAAYAGQPRTRGKRGARETFSGELFLVVRDPNFDQTTQQVSFTDYSVVAVRLSGTASWVGAKASLAVDATVVGEPGRCCGKPTICVPDGPGGGEGPIYATKRIGVSKIRPKAELARRESGKPVITFDVYGQPPQAGQKLGKFPHICTNVIADPLCQAAKPICDHTDVGFTPGTGGGDEGSGSTGCGVGSGGTVTGRNVPKLCTQIMGWESLPPACGGWCESCQQQPPGHDRFCEAARPGPNEGYGRCNPPPAGYTFLVNEQLKAEYGWQGPQDAGTKCSPPAEGGLQQCITCDEKGSCTAHVNKFPYDPTVAATDPNEEDPDEDDSDDSWEVTVDAATFTWRPPPTEPPPAEPPVQPVEKDLPPPANPHDGPNRHLDHERPLGGGLRPDDLTHTVSGQQPPSTSQQPTPGTGGTSAVGDPIDLGSGALLLNYVDMSFPGPVRPLEFTRHYDSGSGLRGSLGSNWLHNWDRRIERLTQDNLPEFLSPWCGGLPEQTAGVLLHDGAAGSELFLLDTATTLFLPQAGGARTLRETAQGGWALRGNDGHLWLFDGEGYLTSDRDRFGVGFDLEYEPTPLGALFAFLCDPQRLAARNESTSSRPHWVLSYLLGKARRPDRPSDSWQLSPTDFSDIGPAPERENLRYAAAYLRHILTADGIPRVPQGVDGGLLRRVRAVTDDLGRTLSFHYHQAPSAGASYDFPAHPEAGLLAEVKGPAGTFVAFGYARPQDYPSELNESFLVTVTRHDQPDASEDVQAGGDRDLIYTYQWPTTDPARPLPPSYDRWRDAVEQRYHAYFATFTGCWYRDAEICGNGPGALGPGRRAEGDPVLLARRAANGYISEVADNIILVEHSGVVDSESRFEADPWRHDYGRVTAQRYGSSSTIPHPAGIPPDSKEDHWRTGLPKATFAYVEAGPDGNSNGDLTDAFLPKALLDRFVLEAQPPAGPIPVTQPVAPANAPNLTSCDYNAMAIKARELPTWRRAYAYYQPPEAERHPRPDLPLKRTRLTRHQLLDAQWSDPTHNDLVSATIPNPTGGPRPVAERILGGRNRIASDANRICAWIRWIDRDGDVTYLGVNHFGQPLVTAISEAGTYIVTERLVNADGSIVQERRPTATPANWSPAAGSTLFTFDEIDPEANRGWNEWLPAFWARRHNLIRVEEHAAGFGVIDEDERDAVFISSVGRFTTYTYEPLFNELVVVESGSLEQRPALTGGALRTLQIRHRAERRIVDYQELSLKLPADDPGSLLPVLQELDGWGFRWARTAAGDYDLAVIASWQLPLELYGADLNGDGAQGDRFSTIAAQRAKGRPVMVVRGRPGDEDVQITLLRWSPHGLPAWIQGPDGDRDTFGYHPLEAPYGGISEPTQASAGPGNRGMPAWQRSTRYLGTYPAVWGPTDRAPCPALAGPYQWLVPADTAPADLGDALASLDLPVELVDDIIDTCDPDHAESVLVTGYTYAMTGHLRRLFTAAGVTEIRCDTDGRVTRLTDVLGVRTEQSYDARGNPVRTHRYDESDIPVGDVRRTFDAAGNLLAEDAALAVGAFTTPPTAQHVHRSYSWTGEERLRDLGDPIATTTTFRYDSRKRLRGVATRDVGGGPGPCLAVKRDLDGEITEIRYGAPDDTATGLLTESFGHDGLGRLVKTVDTRGVTWQHAWTHRDLPSASRRSNVPYGAALPAPGPWESTTGYDALERPIHTRLNGVEVWRGAYTAGGLPAKSKKVGEGTVHVTRDALGTPLWTQTPDGTMTIAGQRQQPARRWTATIRTAENGTVATTCVIQDLDAAGRPLVETALARGVTVSQSMAWDADGNVVGLEDHYVHRIQIDRDWLGRPILITEPLDEIPDADVTLAEHDPRGLPIKVTDASGSVTIYDWDAFGRLRSRRAEGSPPPTETFTYDALGWLASRTSGADTITVVRSPNGDPVRDEHAGPVGSGTLVRRAFDELGRLIHAEHTNPGLPLALADRTVTCDYTYDRLGNLSSETTVAGGTTTTVASQWLAQGDRWQRHVQVICGETKRDWAEDYDPAGRLAMRTEPAHGNSLRRARFAWLGEWYAGSTQDQPSQPSPLRERIDLGPFGLPERIRYTAVDTDSAGQPLSAAEGQQYSGGAPWDPAVCAAPLLDIQIAQDEIGRTGVESIRWSNPLVQGGSVVTQPQPVRWRGYAYTRRNQLALSIEDETPTPPALPGLYAATSATVRAAGQGRPQWTYARESAVGSTTAISSAGQLRWRLVQPRDPGHQLAAVDDGASVRQIDHDAAGRIVEDGDRGYSWHPDGALAEIAVGNIQEHYAYTPDGRLAAVWMGASAHTFAFDGPHLAQLATGGVPFWNASWGPELDALAAWSDTPGIVHLPLRNHRGVVIGDWSPGGGLTWTVDHTPEGRRAIRAPDGAVVCAEPGTGQVCPGDLPLGMTGTWRSPATGLIWLRRRWYDPRLTEFLSPDPLGASDSANPYAYAAFDPINRADPMGLESWLIQDVRQSLGWWQSAVSAAGMEAGAWAGHTDDMPSTGNYYLDETTQVMGSLMATGVSTAIEAVGGFLALGPALVVGVSDAIDHFGQAGAHAAAAWHNEPGAFSVGDHTVLATLHFLAGAGGVSEAVLFAVGVRQAIRYRRAFPTFDGGDVKPMTKGSRSTYYKQADNWGLKDSALLEYENSVGSTSGKVWYQNVRRVGTKQTPVGPRRYLGTVKTPTASTPQQLTPQQLGNRIEKPIRQLMAKRMGTRYAPKLPNAPGPDLPATARPLVQPGLGPSAAVFGGGRGTGRVPPAKSGFSSSPRR